MSNPKKQSAFLRWTDPNTTTTFVRNTLVEVRDAGHMGLGLFALRDISRGTRIIEEEAMFVLPETRSVDNELNAFCSAFQQLTEAERGIFDQLHCCSNTRDMKVDMAVRHWRIEYLPNESDGSMVVGTRCREICDIIYERFNKFRANCVCYKVGNVSGKALYALLSRINHSCVPNTHWVFNTAIERLTVHAVHHIRAGEQITISYIKDPMTGKQVRDSMLARWNFSCSCAACTDPATEARIGRIQELKRLLASYDATLANIPFPLEPIKEALPAAMELVALLEEQGIAGMELASAYKYCEIEIHSLRTDSFRNYAALGDLTRWYACGRDILQEDGSDTEDALSQVEQGFILWEKQIKKSL